MYHGCLSELFEKNARMLAKARWGELELDFGKGRPGDV